jgi:signal transduction histidine kinase
MQQKRTNIASLISFLVLMVCTMGAQSNVALERSLLDSLEQAEGGKAHAFWLKELAWFYKSDRPATAHSYVKSSLEIAQQLNNQKAIADALHTEGLVLWYQGKIAEASKVFFDALKIREEINDSLGLARSYNNIGNVYTWQKNFDEAHRFYMHSMNLRQELKDSAGMVYSLVSLAEVASAQENLEEAQRYGRKALELAQKTGRVDAEAFCYEQLGQIMLNKNQLSEALAYFQDAVELNQRRNNKNQLAENLLGIAEVKAKLGRHQEAIDSLYRSVALSYVIKANDLEAQALRSLGENHAALGQYDSAYFYAVNYEKVDEKISSEKQNRILLDVQEQYRSQLDKTGLLMEQQRISNQRAVLFIIIVILATILGLYYYRQNQLQRRTSQQVEEKAKEIERVNKTLAIRNEDLQESNDSLRQFAYVVSHDLREPLRTIGSFTTLFARRFPDNLDDQGQEYIDFIVKGTRHMSLLLDGLLTYASVSSTDALEQSTINIKVLVQNVLEALDTEIKSTGALVEIDELPVVEGNRALLSQLFQNLIANALKFNDKPEKKVWVRYRDEGDMHAIIVEDNGIGIDESYKAKVFQIFHRLEKNKYKGTGLGLAICQKIAARHRGKIDLESEVGKGTRFIVDLPK